MCTSVWFGRIRYTLICSLSWTPTPRGSEVFDGANEFLHRLCASMVDLTEVTYTMPHSLSSLPHDFLSSLAFWDLDIERDHFSLVSCGRMARLRTSSLLFDGPARILPILGRLHPQSGFLHRLHLPPTQMVRNGNQQSSHHLRQPRS